MTKDCPLIATRVTCGDCGELGHPRIMCTKRSRPVQSTSTAAKIKLEQGSTAGEDVVLVYDSWDGKEEKPDVSRLIKLEPGSSSSGQVGKVKNEDNLMPQKQRFDKSCKGNKRPSVNPESMTVSNKQCKLEPLAVKEEIIVIDDEPQESTGIACKMTKGKEAQSCKTSNVKPIERPRPVNVEDSDIEILPVDDTDEETEIQPRKERIERLKHLNNLVKKKLKKRRKEREAGLSINLEVDMEELEERVKRREDPDGKIAELLKNVRATIAPSSSSSSSSSSSASSSSCASTEASRSSTPTPALEPESRSSGEAKKARVGRAESRPTRESTRKDDIGSDRRRNRSPTPPRKRRMSPTPPKKRRRSPLPPRRRKRSPTPPRKRRRSGLETSSNHTANRSPTPPRKRQRSPTPPRKRRLSPPPSRRRQRSHTPPRKQGRTGPVTSSICSRPRTSVRRRSRSPTPKRDSDASERSGSSKMPSSPRRREQNDSGNQHKGQDCLPYNDPKESHGRDEGGGQPTGLDKGIRLSKSSLPAVERYVGEVGQKIPVRIFGQLQKAQSPAHSPASSSSLSLSPSPSPELSERSPPSPVPPSPVMCSRKETASNMTSETDTRADTREQSDDMSLSNSDDEASGSADPRKKSMYDKHLVYYEGITELSFEELRASKIRKRFEEGRLNEAKEPEIGSGSTSPKVTGNMHKIDMGQGCQEANKTLEDSSDQRDGDDDSGDPTKGLSQSSPPVERKEDDNFGDKQGHKVVKKITSEPELPAKRKTILPPSGEKELYVDLLTICRLRVGLKVPGSMPLLPKIESKLREEQKKDFAIRDMVQKIKSSPYGRLQQGKIIFVLERGLLMTKFKKSFPRIVVPAPTVKKLLKNGHKIVQTKVFEMTRVLMKKLYWSGMAEDIQEFVKNCQGPDEMRKKELDAELDLIQARKSGKKVTKLESMDGDQDVQREKDFSTDVQALLASTTKKRGDDHLEQEKDPLPSSASSSSLSLSPSPSPERLPTQPNTLQSYEKACDLKSEEHTKSKGNGSKFVPQEERLQILGKELVDLLKTQQSRDRKRGTLLMSQFAISYQNHFGKKFNVNYYGHSKLKMLFEELSHIVEIDGKKQGGERITLARTKIVDRREEVQPKVVAEELNLNCDPSTGCRRSPTQTCAKCPKFKVILTKTYDSSSQEVTNGALVIIKIADAENLNTESKLFKVMPSKKTLQFKLKNSTLRMLNKHNIALAVLATKGQKRIPEGTVIGHCQMMSEEVTADIKTRRASSSHVVLSTDKDKELSLKAGLEEEMKKVCLKDKNAFRPFDVVLVKPCREQWGDWGEKITVRNRLAVVQHGNRIELAFKNETKHDISGIRFVNPVANVESIDDVDEEELMEAVNLMRNSSPKRSVEMQLDKNLLVPKTINNSSLSDNAVQPVVLLERVRTELTRRSGPYLLSLRGVTIGSKFVKVDLNAPGFLCQKTLPVYDGNKVLVSYDPKLNADRKPIPLVGDEVGKWSAVASGDSWKSCCGGVHSYRSYRAHHKTTLKNTALRPRLAAFCHDDCPCIEFGHGCEIIYSKPIKKVGEEDMKVVLALRMELSVVAEAAVEAGEVVFNAKCCHSEEYVKNLASALK